MRKYVIAAIAFIFLSICFVDTSVLAASSFNFKIPTFKLQNEKESDTRKDESYKTVLPSNYKWGVKHKKTYKLYDSNGIKHGDDQTFEAKKIETSAKAKPTYIKKLTVKYRNSILRKKKVNLTWQYTGKSRVKYYLIYRRINQGTWEQIGKTTTAKFADDKINTSGTYDYRVTAFYQSITKKNTGDFSSAETSIEIKR